MIKRALKQCNFRENARPLLSNFLVYRPSAFHITFPRDFFCFWSIIFEKKSWKIGHFFQAVARYARSPARGAYGESIVRRTIDKLVRWSLIFSFWSLISVLAMLHPFPLSSSYQPPNHRRICREQRNVVETWPFLWAPFSSWLVLRSMRRVKESLALNLLNF